MNSLNETANKILDAAEAFTQTRGFNAFSYKDLEKEVGIRTASIHYYFPTKQDLADQMADRFLQSFKACLKQLSETNPNGLDRLNSLSGNFVKMLESNTFCLCLMLSTEHLSLAPSTHERVREFFEVTEAWMASTLELAQQQGSVSPQANPHDVAAQLMAILEGGMVIAQAKSDPGHLQQLFNKALTPWTE